MTQAPNMRTVHVVHEYGAPRHFSAFDAMPDVQLKFHTPLSTPRRALSALRHGRLSDAARHLHRLGDWRDVLKWRGETAIFGLAPFNAWLPFLAPLAEHNRVILYTSWPYWQMGQGVHHADSKPLFEAWSSFLQGREVVCVTQTIAENLADFGARTCVIPHSVDCSVFTPGPTHERPLTVLFIGRLVEEKGVLEALQAARTVPDVLWRFVGDGPLADEVARAAAELDNVVYLGHLKGDKLVDAYQTSDLTLLGSRASPRWEELFGITIIEGFACGVAAIATSNVGPRNIITPQTGVLLDESNASAIVRAVRALQADPARLQAMRVNARREAVQRYDLPVVARQWRTLLEGAR